MTTLQQERSLSLHKKHTPPHFDVLMDWLTMTWVQIIGENTSPTLIIVPDNIKDIIKHGDKHYYALYSSNNLLPRETSVEEHVILTSVINELLEIESMKECMLSARRDLWNFITMELGRSVAQKCSDYRVETLSKFWNKGPNSSEYHNGFLKGLDYRIIEENIYEFRYPYGKNFDLEGFSLSGYPGNRKTYTQNELEISINVSLLESIRTTTKDADYLLWNDAIEMIVLIGYRLPPTSFLKWLDSFPWLILQGVVISHIDDFEYIIAIIHALHQTEADSKYALALYCLDCYLNLFRRYTVNLSMAQGSSVNYATSTFTQQALDKISATYNKWIDGGLKQSLENIIDAATDISLPFNREYILALFELISEEDTKKWLSGNVPKVIDEAISHIRKYFVLRVLQHSAVLDFLKEYFTVQNIDWNKISLLKIVEEHAYNSAFKYWLLDTVCKYCESVQFSWRAEFRQESINYVQILASLMVENDQWPSLYHRLAKTAKVYHNGWQHISTNESEKVAKEVFVFILGFGIACELFDRRAEKDANELLNSIIDLLLHQMRTALSKLILEYYQVGLLVYIQICLKYEKSVFSSRLGSIPDLVDNLDFLLPTGYFLDEKIDTSSDIYIFVSKMNTRIKSEFSVLEVKYQKHQAAKLNNILKQKEVWKKIEQNFNSGTAESL